MKTLVLIGMLVVGSSFQAFSMGHPHNVFAARKQMRTKPTVSVPEKKASLSTCWHTMTQATKTIFSVAFSHVSPARSF